MTNVCIVGTGYVGLVTGTIFAEKGHDVVCVDKDGDKIAALERGEIPIYEPGLEDLVHRNRESGRLRFTTDLGEGVRESSVVFIAVGTPPTETGTADLSFIEQVSRQIARHLNGYKVVVEKSTVPVKTGEKVAMTIERNAPDGAEFDVASNPEFLREGSAVADALNPDRIVLGVTSERAETMLRELYADFPGEVVITDIKSAEIIKHASNSFLALKISYINAVSRVCELAGADVKLVAHGMGLDKRIGPRFLQAGIGYGGSCFPKDVDAFRRISESLGYRFDLLEEVQRINREQRAQFLRMVGEELWITKGKKIAVWGIAFKPETDDIRESPALEVIDHLLREGAMVTACDPQACDNAREWFADHEQADNLSLTTDPLEAARDAEALLLVTDWDVFTTTDLDAVREALAQPILVDGRNCFEPREMLQAGWIYRCMGR